MKLCLLVSSFFKICTCACMLLCSFTKTPKLKLLFFLHIFQLQQNMTVHLIAKTFVSGLRTLLISLTGVYTKAALPLWTLDQHLTTQLTV